MKTPAPRRGEVYLIDPQPGARRAQPKLLPCVVISPDDLNASLSSVIVAPLSSGAHPYPFRVGCRFAGRDAHLVLDHLRTVDRARLTKRIGALSAPAVSKALKVLRAMFSA